MKQHRLQHFLLFILMLALTAAFVVLMFSLSKAHLQAWPAMHETQWPLLLGLALGMLIILTSPLGQWLTGRISGYTFHEMRLPFLHVKQEGDRLSVKPCGRFASGILMTPPRVDGSAPYRLYFLGGPLYAAALIPVQLLLALLFKATPAACVLLQSAFLCGIFLLGQCFPRRHATGALTVLLKLRDPEIRRAWACGMHINTALSRDEKLSDMPDDWFHPYKAETLQDITAATVTINISSRLMRFERYEAAYAEVQKLLPHVNRPTKLQQEHMRKACTIINGALCEAVLSLDPLCLKALDDPAVQYMLPANWKGQRTAARYAKAVLVDHNETEAAQLLAELRAAGAEDVNPIIVERLLALTERKEPQA